MSDNHSSFSPFLPYLKEFIPFELLSQGKVRDIYRYSDDQLLIICSDRISAFDRVLDTTIDGKGAILTQLAYFWFSMIDSIVKTQLEDCPKNQEELQLKLIELNIPKEIISHSMLVKKITPLPIEAVVRGYLAGSGYQEYLATSKICGIDLPRGLEEFSKLPKAIFTPATKAKFGNHDVNISFDQAAEIVGLDIMTEVRNISLKIYQKAYQYAYQRGIIIADTKFEFGLNSSDEIVLIDEILTPDSSRYYDSATFKVAGKNQDYSKQIVRDYLIEQKNKTGKLPNQLPNQIVMQTQKRYQQILEILTA